MVNNGCCSGWDDPRLLTLEGLRCRGYTPTMINGFCEEIGVSRSGNENITSIKLLEKYARDELNELAPRTFGVMNPLHIVITNFKDVKNKKCEAPLFPADPSKGTQVYTMSENVYIEMDDFSETHNAKFFGLTPE